MTTSTTTMPVVPTRRPTIWRIAQLLTWAAGMFIWGALIFKPALGLHLLWNVFIPVAAGVTGSCARCLAQSLPPG